MRTAIIVPGGSMSPLAEIAGLSPRHDAGLSFHRRSRSSKLTLDLQERRYRQSPISTTTSPMRRVRSDSDLLRLPPLSHRWSPPVRLEVEEDKEIDLATGLWIGWGAAAVAEKVDIAEIEYSGGGMGSGKKMGRGSGGEGNGGADRDEDRRIESYYQEMLRADPANPLLLRNYGKFLHEVEGDLKGAEDCYGRAILASPGDGELLSLYGQLVWESHRDCKRAESYYERAVQASPDDWYSLSLSLSLSFFYVIRWRLIEIFFGGVIFIFVNVINETGNGDGFLGSYVMGSYAHFLWEAEEEEGDGGGEISSSSRWAKAF
ncbi:hypothetical protein AXF42_Ash009994 [Apostasia shenzhenica]|uniref:Uncharacterized protein n=1 Tax=Apostasia shenzhenica TaxID=1088818 RepID=A0A2I0ACJ2_9ASPA|nr:hypothetical protein AXF42_Ash009994 [Apostasia shenzhenica]